MKSASVRRGERKGRIWDSWPFPLLARFVTSLLGCLSAGCQTTVVHALTALLAHPLPPICAAAALPPGTCSCPLPALRQQPRATAASARKQRNDVGVAFPLLCPAESSVPAPRDRRRCPMPLPASSDEQRYAEGSAGSMRGTLGRRPTIPNPQTCAGASRQAAVFGPPPRFREPRNLAPRERMRRQASAPPSDDARQG
jgi:hypothetical protein